MKWDEGPVPLSHFRVYLVHANVDVEVDAAGE